MGIVYIVSVIGVLLIIGYISIGIGFKKARWNRGQRKDVIIVLGYPVQADGKMSPILRERVHKAEELYRKGIA